MFGLAARKVEVGAALPAGLMDVATEVDTLGSISRGERIEQV